MRMLLLAAACILGPSLSFAGDAPKTAHPFRTDFANAHLPWYMPRPGVFPPHDSARRISGELVQADFIHRTGQFRTSENGELVDFSMPPYGAIRYLNAEADLRDVPLGTDCLFFLNQGPSGKFTRLALMQDRFSIDADDGISYRLDKVNLSEGKLLTTKHSVSKKLADLGTQELLVSEQTLVWKGDKQVKLSDLAIGDELLFNLSGRSAKGPGRCTELWIGADTHKLASDRQRAKQFAFVKARGLPGWIDRVEGNMLTVTLFSGDSQTYPTTFMADLAVGREVHVVVANDELRTWNPPVDQERSKLLEIQKVPVDGYGSSGVRVVMTVAHLLEGFRKGHVVRIFAGGWPAKDQFYGESLMGYGYGRLRTEEIMELPPKEYPAQFPFRTDHGNDQLPWYQLKPGVAPPRFSDHLVLGELVKVDAGTQSGQFRADRTGTLVDFSLIPEASVQFLHAEADLLDLPLGTRCRFHLYQDGKGNFTRASLISDEFSYLARNDVTYRLEALKLNEGKLHVARQIPKVENSQGDLEQPPDIGAAVLLVSADTRVWKGDKQVSLSDLARGDALLINLTSEQPGSPSQCTDLWVGAETHKLATELQGKKHKAAKR